MGLLFPVRNGGLYRPQSRLRGTNPAEEIFEVAIRTHPHPMRGPTQSRAEGESGSDAECCHKCEEVALAEPRRLGPWGVLYDAAVGETVSCEALRERSTSIPVSPDKEHKNSRI